MRTAAQMAPAFAPSIPLSAHRSTARKRPRVSPRRPESSFFEPPNRGASEGPKGAKRVSAPPTHADAKPPSPWVQAALLTLFEPSSTNFPTSSFSQPLPKWVLVWNTLMDLYALRIRLAPRRQVPPAEEVPTAENQLPDVYLVETPSFQESTGLDPAKCVARGIVFGADLLADAVVIEILSRISNVSDVLNISLGVLAAYTSADLVSALYNWLRLNFSPNSSVFGEPDATCIGGGNRNIGGNMPASGDSFSKLVAPHCVVVAPFFICMLLTPPGQLCGDAFVCYFLTFCSLLPAFGQWSTGEPKRVPRIIGMLQNTGVIVRRTSEASFHKLEYGLVCGVWDNFLKKTKLFSAMERWIYIHSGGRIRARVWDISAEARVLACGPNDELIQQRK